MRKMTNKEIKYEIMECLATIHFLRDKIENDSNKAVLETMENRIQKMYKHFKAKHDQDIKSAEDTLNNCL